MKTILTQWFSRLLNGGIKSAAEHERDHAISFDLMIPVSQLYGIEFHPSVYRYYER